ncbi:hypothetical protein [Devosia submarina]|uniref:hypothetical protein n=1 Tax=Devosia submarina TaxID=1173082 RepID=UPI00130096BE|nr:hypothetical protein [Devosia submarina]
MIMRSRYRRRLPHVFNALALVLASAVLFTPKLDSWPTSPQLVVTLFAPLESLGAH